MVDVLKNEFVLGKMILTYPCLGSTHNWQLLGLKSPDTGERFLVQLP